MSARDPASLAVPCVLQVTVGRIVIAHVGVAVGIRGNGGVGTDIPRGVHGVRAGGAVQAVPGAAGPACVLQVMAGIIAVADVGVAPVTLRVYMMWACERWKRLRASIHGRDYSGIFFAMGQLFTENGPISLKGPLGTIRNCRSANSEPLKNRPMCTFR
jgi:hypothetical protein